MGRKVTIHRGRRGTSGMLKLLLTVRSIAPPLYKTSCFAPFIRTQTPAADLPILSPVWSTSSLPQPSSWSRYINQPDQDVTIQPDDEL